MVDMTDDKLFEKRKADVAIFETIQEEQKPWVLHNFGKRPASQPLRGIVEEMGELQQAIDTNNREEIKDSLADAMIFMADYCTAMDIHMSFIVEEGFMFGVSTNAKPIKMVGALCHADLKLEQGIRDMTKSDVENELINITEYLVGLSQGYGFDLAQITREVWDKVKKRDWKKDAANAGTAG